MLFNLFGGKKEDGTPFTDRVYMSSNAKNGAILKLAKDNSNTVFVGWFSQTISSAKKLFQENLLDEGRIIDYRHFHSGTVAGKEIVFLEHYPLPEKEKQFIANLQQQKFIVFSAMDEPIFLHFGSEKMAPMLKMLGLKEEEAIEHNYVSQSITRGQNRIAEQVTLEQSADSQEEWMRKNLTK